jgi:hypothetical protein
MQFVFGTVNRKHPIHDGGVIGMYDTKSRKIIRSVQVFPQNPEINFDPNPRGQTRGCRGICATENRIFACNFHSILEFDYSLNLINSYSHGMAVGLHELFLIGNAIWCTATSIDTIFKFDLNTKQFSNFEVLRNSEWVQKKCNTTELDIDLAADNRLLFLEKAHSKNQHHLHTNAVIEHQGDVLVLFNTRGVIWNVSKQSVFLEDKILKGSHNLVISDNHLFTSASIKGGVSIFSLDNKQLVQLIDFNQMSKVKKFIFWDQLHFRFKKVLHKLNLADFPSKPLFVRGLQVYQNQVFAGISPASVVHFDLQSNKIIDLYSLSNNPDKCIHGLCLLKHNATAN